MEEINPSQVQHPVQVTDAITINTTAMTDVPVEQERLPSLSIGFSCSWISRIGDRQENQDMYIVTENMPSPSSVKLPQSPTKKARTNAYRPKPSLPVWGILDGHGSLGKAASKFSATFIQSEIGIRTSMNMTEDEINVKVKEVLRDTQECLMQSALKNKKEYGTTALVVILCDPNSASPKLITANVGDSRAVLFRPTVIENNNNNTDNDNKSSLGTVSVLPLSIDHKLHREDEVERIKLTPGRVVTGSSGQLRGIMLLNLFYYLLELKDYISGTK